MNTDQVEGKWEQIKGRAKKAWGQLTDDDFLKAEGSIDKLYGVIQEKVGDTHEAVRDRLAQADHEDGAWTQAKGRAKRAWGELTEEHPHGVVAKVEHAKDAVVEKAVDVKDTIREKVAHAKDGAKDAAQDKMDKLDKLRKE